MTRKRPNPDARPASQRIDAGAPGRQDNAVPRRGKRGEGSGATPGYTAAARAWTADQPGLVPDAVSARSGAAQIPTPSAAPIEHALVPDASPANPAPQFVIPPPADAGEPVVSDATSDDVAATGQSARVHSGSDDPAGGPVEAQPGEPPITTLIELNPEPTGGFIFGRFDIQVRGRVASSALLEAVELVVDGTVIDRVEFGRPDRAASVMLPGGIAGRERNFEFTLPLPQARPIQACVIGVRATTVDGVSCEEIFALAIDPTAPQPVSVITGPTRPGAGLSGARPPLVLYVERAMIDSDGGLMVHGWAVALNPIVTVQAFLCEAERLPAAQFGIQREDVGSHYSAYPNAHHAGFTLSGQLVTEGARAAKTLRVQAISLNGYAHEVLLPIEHVQASPGRFRSSAATGFAEEPLVGLAAPAGAIRPPVGTGHAAAQSFAGRSPEPAETGARRQDDPTPDPRRKINWFCDEAGFAPDGRLRVVGWAVCAVGLAEVAVHLNGERIGAAELGLPRPDVGEEFASIPAARLAGFRLDQPIPGLTEGLHELRLVLRNAADDERTESRILRATTPVLADPELPPAADLPEFRFELDSPQVVAGVVVEPITGRLTIEGWVLARSGVASIDVQIDDVRLGEAHYGLARQDVGAAFPEWEGSLRSGYAFHCPPRALRDGEHDVTLTVRAKNGQALANRFRIDVRKSEEDGELATIRRRMTQVESGMLGGLLDDLGYRPAFHLLLRQGSTIALDGLRATVEALRHQVYRSWQLTVLVEDPDAAFAVRLLLADCAADLGERVTVLDATQPGFDTLPCVGDAGSNTLFGALCPGDLLGCDALAELALAGGLHRQAEFLYADEARISPASNQREPFFKPDFSPDLLLSTNYIGRPWVASADLLQRCNVTPRLLLAQGEHDVVLRCTEQATAIHHVPKLLAQRGPELLDDEATSRAALAQAAERRGTPAEVKPGCVAGTFRLQRTQPASGKVSIIIPTCAAHGYIETCIRTLREKTAYANFEIVCIDNIPESEGSWKVWLQQNADQIVDIPEAFNWSRFNNRAVAATDSDYLLFLNDDIEIEQDDWLDVLLEHAQRPEVGIVGPQLLYPDRKVQHAGMFLGAGIGRHAFRFAPADDPGYFGLALTQRNVMAVTGACMLVRRDFFEAQGGFDEAHSVINNDLDFCLRAHRAGKLTVFTPHATLIHHELASRDRMKDVFDTTNFDSHWRTVFAAGDPYFSPRLSRHSDDYRPDDEPVQTVFSGHPLFERRDIQRILVVKLDHIGDFVTALPAIRRLKSLFPQASITVLAGRAARAFTYLEPAIDAFIEFEFFHVRSQLGEKDLTKADFEALEEQLAEYRFDLAIDLRKHLSTRDVLRHTGARFLAGYDYMGQFPFLDIALEWDGDKTLHRKRSHVVDDLLALVEAVATASTGARELVATPPLPFPLDDLSPAVQALFTRPVVAIHPGAGNITKQWPAEYFTGLIDLLVERSGVNVLLVGGPDDREVADLLLQRALLPERLASVAGAMKLADLPRMLVRCALYIGNDSGPKHIAAAVGVPTIGIHSGVVDAAEWGPLGRRAVALRRNMTCSPCYLARAEDCPRNLACLRYLEPSSVYQMAELLLARPVATYAPLEATALNDEPRMDPAEPERDAEAGSEQMAADRSGAVAAADDGLAFAARPENLVVSEAAAARPGSSAPRTKSRAKSGRRQGGRA